MDGAGDQFLAGSSLAQNQDRGVAGGDNRDLVEYLTNLDQIGAARCRFIALPLKLEGADGSPVRAIALVE